MPSFVKGGGVTTPFGRNEYLRSVRGTRFEHYTFAAATLPSITIDGVTGQKILQPGTVLAKITSGGDAGKVGPFQGAGTAEVQTITKTGTWTGGTYTLTVLGKTTGVIAWNADATAIQAALTAAGALDVVVTGGPLSTTAVVLTFSGSGNIAASTIDTTLVTGTTPGAGVVETTAGTAGANDGRGVLTNIVGLNDTFLPWQLMERDVEVASLYSGTAVQAWCFELNSAGTFVALTNTTADACRGTKGLHILFK